MTEISKKSRLTVLPEPPQLAFSVSAFALHKPTVRLDDATWFCAKFILQVVRRDFAVIEVLTLQKLMRKISKTSIVLVTKDPVYKSKLFIEMVTSCSKKSFMK